MSGSREAKNARQLEQRIDTFNQNGYAALDQEKVYALAINNPAGFGDMSRTAPGSILTSGQVQQAFASFQAGAYDDGAESLTFDKWVSDDRTPLDVQDGLYVYRPESTAGRDYVSKDRETLAESLGAFPFVLAAFAAPFAASLGATTAAGSASGINALNSFDTGAMAEILGTNVGAGASIGATTLTVAQGAGTVLETLKPIGTVAGAVGSVAGAVGAVATATGAVVQAERAINPQEPFQPVTPQGVSQPFIFQLPGASDMATKTASTAASPASSFNLQSLLPIIVVAVLAFAVLSELKE